jgi:hypothetical protein
MDITLNMTDMDMADLLDELTYRLLANADNRTQARDRATILGHWAQQQAARLDTGRGLRVDHASVVAEALAPAAHRPRPAGGLSE